MKTILSVLISFTILAMQAQITINLYEKEYKISKNAKNAIMEYQKKIDSLIQVEKAMMKAELEEADQQYEEGQITEQQMESLKEDISEKYAIKIENGVEELSDDLESIIQEQVEVSLYSDEDIKNYRVTKIGVSEIKVNVKKRKYKKLNRIVWGTQFGFSNLSDGWNLNSSSEAKITFGKSVAFTFGPLYHYQPTITSPFTLITGLQFRTNNIRADKGYFFIDNAQEEATIAEAPYEHLRKAKLRTNSLHIPMGFKYTFKEIKHQEEGDYDYRNVKKGFYIGMLLYGGLNLSSKSIIKYYNEKDHRDKDKITLSTLNNILYGLEFNFGYKGYNFYFRKDLNDFFNKTTLPVNQNFEFGIRTGF